jgi:DNA helicase-2/ATP-dependent DNA helicase PcrA
MNVTQAETAPEKEEPKLTLTYISYSQLQTYLMCPLHYKLRYIMNVPTPPSPALSYGVSVHSSLRDFFLERRADQRILPERMKDILKKNWISLGYTGREHEEKTYSQAEAMLVEFAHKTASEKPETLAVELPFNFWLMPSKLKGDDASSKHSMLNTALKVGGRIDRIDRLSDGRIEIIDYKTGPNVPTEKKVKEDFQLSFYGLAATEVKDQILSRQPEELVLSLYYLEAGKKLSTTRTKDELQMAKEKIFGLLDEISYSDFHCSGGMWCKNCEYKMVCQSFGN